MTDSTTNKKPPRGLLPHEQALWRSGALRDVTHANSTSIWLHADSGKLPTPSPPEQKEDTEYDFDIEDTERKEDTETDAETEQTLGSDYTFVYRPMGDLEILYLVEHNQLPDTQPYQAIIEGENGRTYAEKFLKGRKKVDTHPTAVVEFCVPSSLIKALFDKQHKVEDGAMSMGLGDKAGGGLSMFNDALMKGVNSSDPRCPVGWRIVTIKRPIKRKGKRR